MSMATESNLEKLQRLLRQMFQFDCSDLDFGIYRIMNHKRDAVDRFIQKDLPAAISKELSSGVLASQSRAVAELQDVAGQIRESLGDAALNGDGRLAEAYHGTPLGKRYLDLQARATGAQARPALEAAIFNHLYAFFSRYYDAGDFLSKRRYSRKEKYAIPYNGEEVYLHWANSDQYYVKTGEHFTDYRFTSRGLTVHFRLQQASVERDNVKGDKRFFVPLPKVAVFDAKAKEIVVPFEYRPLTEQEDVKYGRRNQQEQILAEAQEAILKQFGKANDALAALTAAHHQTAEGQLVSCLEHHLRRYTQVNTSDFFVHKDLKGFLTHELDFYLKNEVLNLDDVEAAGETRAEGWFQVMRVIRAIGEEIILFLAQIEDFQKRLFEKKKFVIETNYCITVGNVPALPRGNRGQRRPVAGVEGPFPHRRGGEEPLQRRRQEQEGSSRGLPEGPSDAGPGHSPLRPGLQGPAVGQLRRPGRDDRRLAHPQRKLPGSGFAVGEIS